MHCEADRPPPAVIRQRLPQHRHVRVVTADETLVEWLLEGPHCRRGRTRSRRACSAANGAELEIHDDTVAYWRRITRIWFRPLVAVSRRGQTWTLVSDLIAAIAVTSSPKASPVRHQPMSTR